MTTTFYNRPDSVEFAKKVSCKFKGWYSNDSYHEKAVKRIALQREEIYSLLKKVEKVSVKKLLKYLDASGFFYRPSAPNKHHNFPGGLAEHSLGVFRIVEKWNNMSPDERRESELYNFNLKDKEVLCDILSEKMNYDDMVIAAICHDLCKATRFFFDGRIIRKHSKESNAHSSLSVKRLMEYGIVTPECEEIRLAVLMHMGLYRNPSRSDKEAQYQDKARKSMIAIVVWAADKLDASRYPAGRLHMDF